MITFYYNLYIYWVLSLYKDTTLCIGTGAFGVCLQHIFTAAHSSVFLKKINTNMPARMECVGMSSAILKPERKIGLYEVLHVKIYVG